jgi:NOL1/NOP2/fmu family ribosome biogenesis protein
LPAFASDTEKREILNYFKEHFGIPERTFHGFRLLIEKKTVWVVSDIPGLEEILDKLKIETAGVPLLRLGSFWKPTTAGLQLFSQEASRNTIELDDHSLKAFLNQAILEGPLPLEPGYAILRWKGNVLGCGIYGRSGLRCQIPEDRLRRLKGSAHRDS